MVAGSQLSPAGVSGGASCSISWVSEPRRPNGTWRLHGLTSGYSPDMTQTASMYLRIDNLDLFTLRTATDGEFVRNCRYSSADNSTIDCEIMQRGQWLPFTASPQDCTEWGPAIYKSAVEGRYGEVAAYLSNAPV